MALSFESIYQAGEREETRLLGRNTSSVVVDSKGELLFRKEFRKSERHTVGLNESRALRFFQTLENRFGIGSIAPEFVSYSMEDGILFTEYLDGAEALDHLSVEDPYYWAGIRQVSHLVGLMHSVAATINLEELDFQKVVPFLPTYRDLTPYKLSRLVGRDARIAVKLIQPIDDSLAELFANSDSERTLIHADLKSSNIVRIAAGSAIAQIVMTDWEFAGIGDPMWDLGSIIGQSISSWLTSIDMSTVDLQDLVRSQGRIPFHLLRKHLRDVVADYQNALAVRSIQLIRAFQYSGVFLLQRLCAEIEYRGRITASVRLGGSIGKAAVQRPKTVMEFFL